jgi:RsiW-degrading membrane proteinase PrsW (M82 family)
MDMTFVTGIALSVLFGIVPMVIYAAVLTLFDRYEREPPLLMLGVFLWGLIVAAGSSLILNTIFGIGLFVVSGSEGLANFGTAVISAPLVEETVKGLAVLTVFVYFRHEFDSILDGVIYGSLVGFGFAAAENINYIFQGFVEGGFEGLAYLVFVRAILIAFLHATLTAFTGIGFAIARLNKGVLRFVGPVFGFVTAIALHGFHNLFASLGSNLLCLFGSLLDWTGFLGMFVFILYLMWREGKIMRTHLADEVQRGHISSDQYNTAVSIFGQMGARWGALAGGRWRSAARFYDLLGELAFKKHQLHRLGAAEERQAEATIEKLRGQIAALGPKA